MPTLGAILTARRRSPPFWCGISDRHLFEEAGTAKYLDALFRTRADIILWREKDLTREENRIFVREGARLASRENRLFLVSTDYILAAEEGADGAHLTSDQELAEALTVRPGTQFLLGKSVHSVSETVQAESEGADYVLLAPIFDPISKRAYRQSLGLEVLRDAVTSVAIPVFALGGITAERGSRVLEAGAFGLAGISLLLEDLSRSMRHP